MDRTRNAVAAKPLQTPRLPAALDLRRRSLQRGLELASVYQLGFGPLDVACVEASWEMLEDDSSAHGFVLTLRDGQRRYLQYVAVFEDEVDEDVQTLPMGDEPRPQFNIDGSIVWANDVDDLNRLFVS